MWTGDKQPPDTSLYALPGAHDSKNPFEVSDVDRVEIKRARPNAETIVLVRASKTSPWQIEEPHKLRAGAVVTDLVTQILGATRDPEADVPADLKAAGLDTARRGRHPQRDDRRRQGQEGRGAVVPAERRRSQLRVLQGGHLRHVAGSAQGDPARPSFLARHGAGHGQRLPRSLPSGLRHL